MVEAVLAGVLGALLTAAVAVGLCYELIQRKIEQVEVEIKSMQRVRDDLHVAFEDHDGRYQSSEAYLRDALKTFKEEERKEYAEENVRRDLLAATRFVDFVFGRYKGKEK